jgi:phage-related protein (TIGR01555 family)
MAKFPPGRSGNPKGRPPATRRDAAEVERARAAREDGWTSLLNGLGNIDFDKRLSVSFGTVCPVTIEQARNLWRGNDLAKKIIEKLPKHEFRAGFEVEIKDDDSAEGEDDEGTDEEDEGTDRYDWRSDPRANTLPFPARDGERTDAVAPASKPDPALVAAKEEASAKRRAKAKKSENASERVADVHTEWKRLAVLETLRKARYYQRAYGGAGIILGVQDNAALDQPLDVARIRSFDFLTLLEPREFSPRYYYGNPLAPKYGQVEIWQVMPYRPGAARSAKEQYGGSFEVHETRLIHLKGFEVSRQITHGVLAGHGDSILTPVYEVLRDYGIGWAAAGVLLTDFSQAVYKMAGLADLLGADNAEEFAERMRNMERGRSIARVTIIGEKDEFERKATPMTGLPELLGEFKARVAAAAEMPVTELFGVSAGGLNATGEGDRESWFGDVSASCDEHVIPPLTRITEVCLQVTGGVPDSWSVCAKPLEQESAGERATREKTEAEADSLRIADGVVSAEEVAVSRFADGKGSLRIDFEAREELEAAAAKPVTTEGEDPDVHPPVIGPNGEEVKPGTVIMDPPKDPNKKPPPKR